MSEERDDFCRSLSHHILGEYIGGKEVAVTEYTKGDGQISVTMEDGSRWNINVTPLSLLDELESTRKRLDYMAECFHVIAHGIKEARSWRDCGKPSCRAARGDREVP